MNSPLSIRRHLIGSSNSETAFQVPPDGSVSVLGKTLDQGVTSPNGMCRALSRSDYTSNFRDTPVTETIMLLPLGQCDC